MKSFWKNWYMQTYEMPQLQWMLYFYGEFKEATVWREDVFFPRIVYGLWKKVLIIEMKINFDTSWE